MVDGELTVVLVQENPAQPERGWVPSFDFELRVGGLAVGRINFRAGTTVNIEQYGGHFGYEVDAAHRGHHYAERAVRLLFPFAKEHGLTEVWITCEPTNVASRRTCERLGAQLVGVVPLPQDNDMYRAGQREKCRFLIRLT